MMIACLIVSMLSNSITMLTRTLCWRSARSIALRIVNPASKATNVSPLRSAGVTTRRRASRWFGWHTNAIGSDRSGTIESARSAGGYDMIPTSASPWMHRLDDLVRVQALELNARFRIERHEALHVAAHVVEADRVDRRHPHRSVDPRLHRARPPALALSHASSRSRQAP